MEQRISQRLLRAATAGFVVAAASMTVVPVSATTVAERVDSSHRIFIPYAASCPQGNEALLAKPAQTENPPQLELDPEPGQILNDTTYTTTVGVPITMDPSLNIAENYWQWLFHNGPWSINVITDGLPFEVTWTFSGIQITPTLEGRLSIPVTLEFGDYDHQVFNEVSYMNLDILPDPTAIPPNEQPTQDNSLFLPSISG